LLPKTLFLTALAAGCAGNYRLEAPAASAKSAPLEVLNLRWHKKLVTRELLDYRPQEWATPAFGENGVLFVGSSAKRLWALRVQDGTPVWKLNTLGAISSTPLYSSTYKTLFFGADDGKMYAVDKGTGKVRWRYATQGTVNREPALSEGFLLFTSSEGRVYGLDAKTGKWRWQYERELPEGFTIKGYAGVAVQGSTAFTGFADGTLVALRAYSGDVIWTRRLTGTKKRFVDLDSTPVLADGLLLATSYAGGVYAISPDTGSIRWQFPVEGAAGLLVHRDLIYFTSPKMGVVALDRAGRIVWRQAIMKGIPSTPVAAGPFLFICGSETGLYVVSARTGRLLQFFDPGHGISAPPAARSGYLSVVTNQGWLYTFFVSRQLSRDG
jgi:outer membrane protein assembly factor BamB